MGSSDIPPPSAPAWIVPASTICLSTGVTFWLLAYILMVRRSLATGHTPAPLVALGLNLAWEVVYAFGVCEAPIEFFGFTLWLLFDIPVVYATLKTAPRSFAGSPLVARNVPLILVAVFAAGLVGNGLFVWWWLKEPHRGYGIKWGKNWKGLEARDTTELAFWSAGVAQMMFSVGALSMLLQRGHSGGQSYAIWFCRFIGTVVGLPISCILLWWHWPEAHGFVFHPLGLFFVGTAVVCDLLYPFLLAYVRSTERILPDGTVMAGETFAEVEKKQQ
ncbi:uncharacterized protein NECHADRAFT_95821 [Fusarium vanettenii 77-13-4]|uniref:Uncharacterized protein n=1 Tax=Fusarium vanettenii (strain ATCC MYA-4622 / CBS 123669 / FGSC 9596 / NRRL 45880 / 77-13-4) TaxID=660122 RepID=C7YZV9_FUSV7|nr:uncharacterized protein NECHADRAFT_95821 [Fusarium vanettenii 77-13-4]EEU42865.1 predicted protein [Fusarium vanettenii 77-13-4]